MNRTSLRRGLALALAATLLGSVAAQAQTVEVAGVKFPPSVQLAGSTLQLNGAGVRYIPWAEPRAGGSWRQRATQYEHLINRSAAGNAASFSSVGSTCCLSLGAWTTSAVTTSMLPAATAACAL